ncbi:MAG: SdiA-regulated domain-containing protein [Chitinophagales bacterium]
MNKTYLYIALLILLSCMGKKKDFRSPAGYDLTKPDKFYVPEALDEVSGICFFNGNNDTLYAEQDEEGKVYYLHLGDKKARHVKFAKGGDYEDIVVANGQLIVLRSDGRLFSFPFHQIHEEEVTDVKEWDGLLPKGEYEGLCADVKNNQLYVLCKNCPADKTTKAVTAYILQLQPGGNIIQSGSASISVKTIEVLSGEKKFKFNPSGLAKNPKTGQYYIVSAVNDMLVIADSDWTVKEVYHIDPSTFRQPEGIAFDNENNLYISNEGDELSRGNVLKFVFSKNN